MTQTVVGIFDDASSARNAVERLIAYGFTQTDIDISNPAEGGYSGSTASSTDTTDHSDDGLGDKISRFFRNLFDDEQDVERYSEIARSRTVVSVYAQSMDEAQRAANILDEFGAVNVDERASGYDQTSTATAGYGETSAGAYDTTSSNENSSLNRDDVSDRSIPVIEEELQVGKREVETGGVRLRSRIIERPVEESLRLREEHVRIDRQPVNRPATESDLKTFREGEIEVRERAEVPVVNKEARVVEEVNVRKEVGERDEVVRETVRKTEVDAEQMDSDTEVKSNKSKSRKNS